MKRWVSILGCVAANLACGVGWYFVYSAGASPVETLLLYFASIVVITWWLQIL